MNQCEVRCIDGIFKGIPDEEGIAAHPLGIKSCDGNEKYGANQEGVIGAGVIPDEFEQDSPGYGDRGTDEEQIAEYIEWQRQKFFREIKFVYKRSPDYKIEFINGAASNLTPRGEIICDFHFESKDRPMEQIGELTQEGFAKLDQLQENLNFTRDVKFGIIMNVSFAEDLIEMLKVKIEQGKEVIASREKKESADESVP